MAPKRLDGAAARAAVRGEHLLLPLDEVERDALGVGHLRDGRGVSDQYGMRDAACPLSTGGGGGGGGSRSASGASHRT